MTKYVKYPRTPHLPFSESKTDDDKTLSSTSHFINQEVVVSVKMDGENTTMYNDHIHARSIESKYHESREWVKRIHGNISYLIPDNYRICGENLYAQHSIAYNNLSSFFNVFSVWENNNCLDWDSTVNFVHELNLELVPIIYRGIYNEQKIIEAYKEYSKKEPCEGFVVRLASNFSYENFGISVAKFVRKNHVQTDKHWMHSKVVPNKLKT